MKRLLFIPVAAVVVAAGMYTAPHQVAADVVMPTDTPRIAAKRCTIAKGRIGNITDTMKTIAERRTTAYTNARERVIARVAVLKQKGYDTAKLEADLKTLNTQISDYHTKVGSLADAMTAAQDAACGDNDGMFTSALANARTQLKAVRSAADTVHATMRSTIVPDIKDAANWAKNN